MNASIMIGLEGHDKVEAVSSTYARPYDLIVAPEPLTWLQRLAQSLGIGVERRFRWLITSIQVNGEDLVADSNGIPAECFSTGFARPPLRASVLPPGKPLCITVRSTGAKAKFRACMMCEEYSSANGLE
jgi:hypothetical protein